MNHKGWYDGYSFWIDQLALKLAFHLPGDTHKLISNNDVTTNTWHHVAATYDSSLMRIYIDGTPDPNTLVKTDNIEPSTSEMDFWIGHGDQPKDVGWSGEWEGQIDEVRLSDIGRTGDWIKTEFNNQDNPNNFYAVGTEQTLVELSYFRAKPLHSAVLLEWATEAELDNEGFNILRREGEDREYENINPYLIPARGLAGFGAEYSFTDHDVENGVTYYYLLEDVDFYGKSTLHGPVSATPNDIILIWPRDWEVFPSGSSLFSWVSSGDLSFKVDVCSNPSFLDSETITFPKEGWVSELSLWLRPEERERILKRARLSGGQLFWRIRAKSQDGRVIYSKLKRFVVDY